MGNQKSNIKKIPWYCYKYGFIGDEWLDNSDFYYLAIDGWLESIYLSLLNYMIIKNIKNKFYIQLLESKEIENLQLLYNMIIHEKQEENK